MRSRNKQSRGLKIEREQLIESIRRQSERLVFPADEPLRIESARQDRRQLDHLEQSRVDKEKTDRGANPGSGQAERKNWLREPGRGKWWKKLKDRDFAQWQKEMARLDQVQLDEISSIAFNRRRRQGGEVRTYILLGIMLILLFALLYLTGTVSGRQWMGPDAA